MTRIQKLTASFTRPGQAVAYTAGDIVANSQTAADVAPMEFRLQHGFNSGKITGARAVVKPASGNLVITAMDLDLLLFRAETDIPFAAAGYPADNAALTLTEAMYKQLVGVFSFVNGAWRNPLGALTAGAVGWQAVAPTGRASYAFAGFSVGEKLRGVLQAKAGWDPGNVAQAITIDLDVEAV